MSDSLKLGEGSPLAKRLKGVLLDQEKMLLSYLRLQALEEQALVEGDPDALEDYRRQEEALVSRLQAHQKLLPPLRKAQSGHRDEEIERLEEQQERLLARLQEGIDKLTGQMTSELVGLRDKLKKVRQNPYRPKRQFKQITPTRIDFSR